MRGTSLLRARSPELLEDSFERVMNVLGAKSFSPEKQIQKLLTIPMSKLRAKLGRRIPRPMVDHDMIPKVTNFKDLAGETTVERVFPGIKHCKRIIIGGCKMDVSLSLFQ